MHHELEIESVELSLSIVSFLLCSNISYLDQILGGLVLCLLFLSFFGRQANSSVICINIFFKADPGMFYMLIRYISAVAGDLTAVFQLFSYSCLELREILFIQFWLRWVFVAVWALLQLRCAGFSLQWLLFLRSTGCKASRLQWLWLLRSTAQAQQLWHTGLAAPWRVGSSQTRD